MPKSVTTIGVQAFYGTELKNVWYTGTEADRAAITVGEMNDELLGATWHYTVCRRHVYSDDKDSYCNTCGFDRALSTPGDVNDDGKIDSTDARLTLQYAVKKIDEHALNLSAADVDGNGRADSTDARLILQYAVKKITRFPIA